MQDGCVGAEVTQCDSLLEQVAILHIDSQPKLDAVVFRDEVSQARTEGISQAI